MATNEIEIEVTLDSKGAEKGLERLEQGGEAVGETFNSVGASVSALGGEMNERLGAVGESVGGLTESMMGLSSAVMNSGGSFLGLIGPIGAVVVALSEVISAYKEYSGEAEKIEIRTDAYTASAAELTSIIEELAAAQVSLNLSQIEELRVLSMQAKIPAETAQKIREKNAARVEEIQVLDQRITRLRDLIKEQERLNKTRALPASLLSEQYQLNMLIEKRAQKQADLSRREQEADILTSQSLRERAKVEKIKENYLKTGEKAVKERAQREAALLEQARIRDLQRDKENVEAQTKIAILESQKRERELRQIEDISETVRAQAIMAEHRDLNAKLEEIRKADAKRRRAEAQKTALMRRAALAKRIAQEKIAQAELARIQRAEIENMRIMGADQLELLERQQALELELAGNNARAREAITLEFENRRLVIQQEAERKRQEAARKAAEEERQRDEQRRALRFDSIRFNLEMMSDGLDKELALLELKYRREMEIRGRSEEEITELTRRYNIERNRMIEANTHQAAEALFKSLDSMNQEIQRNLGGVLFDSFTSVKTESREAFKALSDEYKEEQERIKESSEDAAFINQQMTELTANYARERANIRQEEEGAPGRMIGELLLALGKQASVEALMMTAKGIAATFTNPAASAGYFAAAGIMGAAAATAGYAGIQLGAGSSPAGGGSIAPESPTGSPQSAPAPERERAESTAMVFNVNFANSTIYDTKRAAQDAMASEIMRTINRQRRGAPRFAMG